MSALDRDGGDLEVRSEQKFAATHKGASRKADVEICSVDRIECIEKVQICAENLYHNDFVNRQSRAFNGLGRPLAGAPLLWEMRAPFRS